MPDDEIDKELDPKKLWELTPEQIKAWLEVKKKRDRKLAKNWRPLEH